MVSGKEVELNSIDNDQRNNIDEMHTVQKTFLGVDIELYASTLSQPLRCPKCGSVRTRPSRLFCPFSSDIVYKKIWNQFDPTLQK